MINIVGGKYKKTKLNVPLNIVRPTSVQKREAIFSIIESYGLKINFDIYKQKNVLDLFAGSGALGLEAISRGISFGYFYENNFKVIPFLKKNCLKICKKNNFQIKQENILNSNFSDINKKISVVFIDPPYKIKPFKIIFKKIIQSKILSKNAIIIVEYSKDSNIEIPSFFSCYAERQYRNTKISFLIIKNNNNFF